MARKPNKKPARQKPPSLNQRLRAEAKRAQSPLQGMSGGAVGRQPPDVRVSKAQRAWDERKYEEAIWYYERALAHAPNNPVLMCDVARAYALRFRYDDAEKLVARAQLMHADDAQFQQMLGRTYVQIQQFDRAIQCFRRSLELAPTSPDRAQSLLELAQMYERLHDLGAARECAEEALALEPKSEKTCYQLANIERRSGNSERAESLWRSIIENKTATLRTISESWYELAALHDKAGRFDEAFQALIEAKKILARAATPYYDDAWTIAENAGKTFARITPEILDRWSAAASELTPMRGGLALLTSHPRSGTTLLEQVLDSHPTAVSADELQVLAELVNAPLGRSAKPDEAVPTVLDRTSSEVLNQLRRDYRVGMEGALRQPIGDRLLIDKNPELTLLIPLVARVFPEMKIVFALRDPRDVVVSCFMQRLPLNAVSVNYLTLENTVKKYALIMRSWLKIRSMLRNPWIEVRYEDMVADLEGQARRVLEFLGLPWDEQVLQYHQRAQQKHVHSPTYEAVTKPIYTSSVARWRNYAQHLEPHLATLQPYIDAFGYA